MLRPEQPTRFRTSSVQLTQFGENLAIDFGKETAGVEGAKKGGIGGWGISRMHEMRSNVNKQKQQH